MQSKLSISKAALLNVLSKLHLEKGDVLIVKDHETLAYLAQVHLPLEFNVPLVYAPGGLQKLTRQDLLNLLEQLEQSAAAPPDNAMMPTAPL